MSSDQDRSLGSSGISIPQWMKNKADQPGFDPSAFSPPTHEDDFFYIKFPKAVKPLENSSDCHNLSEVLEVKEGAFSKHTTSCKQFIPNIKDSVPSVKPKVLRPMGVDDGFKGEAAACGASVVAVAQQMLAGSFTTDDAGDFVPQSYLRQRRNSKSLPASPLATPHTSPRSKRKNNTLFALQNRFFTGPFVATEKPLEEEKKSSSGWMLAGLLSQHREVESKGEERGMSDLLVSQTAADAVQMTVELAAHPAERTDKPAVYKPKASELREMNFWSPTSM